jgi:clusterin-associated protein 1
LNAAPGISGDSSHLDHQIDSSLASLVESTNEAVERLDKQYKILISNQRGMEEKMRKKTIDLERNSKRLESLKNVRPAYMDEYEKLEEELQVEHERYVVRLRNVGYLEGELASVKQAATERRAKAERSMKRMQKKIREEKLMVLNGPDDCM